MSAWLMAQRRLFVTQPAMPVGEPQVEQVTPSLYS